MEGYWFNNFLAFEERQKRTNRVILNVRHWSPEGSTSTTVYLKHNVTIPTRFFHYRQDKNDSRILRQWKNNGLLYDQRLRAFLSRHDHRTKTLGKQGILVETRRGNYNVYQLEVPHDHNYLDLLDSNFQVGAFNQVLRFQHQWLDRKLRLDSSLEEAFTLADSLTDDEIALSEFVESYAKNTGRSGRQRCTYERRVFKQMKQFFGTEDLEIARLDRKKYASLRKLLENEEGVHVRERQEQVRGKVRSIDNLLKQVDPRNQIIFSEESNKYEITLNSTGGIEFLTTPQDGKELPVFLSEEEARQQVFCYGDLEKPLWKREDERINIKRRKRLRSWLEKEQDVGRKERIHNLVQRVEEGLTKEIAGYMVPLYEESYDAIISLFAQSYSREDGRKTHVVDKIRREGFTEVHGFTVEEHESEHDLLNAVIRRMKQLRVYAFVGHNLAYDIIQSRDGARKALADSFDVAVDRREPRRDFVRKVMQRLGEDMKFFDTCLGLGYGHMPFLPKHNLAAMTNCLFGEGSFEKALTYDELREREIRAIHGDKIASYENLSYGVTDIHPLIRMVEETPFLTTVMNVKKIMPYATSTSIAFSPRSVSQHVDYKHFSRAHNLRNFGREQKKREDEKQFFKRDFPRYWQEKLKEQGVLPQGKQPKTEVIQAYAPLELLVKDVLLLRHPEWQSLFADLSDEPLQRFAELQYPQQLLNYALQDFHFAVQERERARTALKLLGVSRKTAIQSLHAYEEQADLGLKKESVNLLRQLGELYRDVCLRLSPKQLQEIKRTTRAPEPGSIGFLFSELNPYQQELGRAFTETHHDWIVFADQEKRIKRMLPEDQHWTVERFISSFHKMQKNMSALSETAQQCVSEETDPNNLVYLASQTQRVRKLKEIFSFTHGIQPFTTRDSEMSLEKKIDSALHTVKEDLENRNARAIKARPGYLFVTPVDTDFTGSPLIPMRTRVI